MQNIDKQYQDLLQDILENGVTKKDRTGTGTISVFGRQIRHQMSEGFPILTTKKIHWSSIVSELLWFLQGRTDLKWLLDHGNTIWVGDALKKYLNTYKGNFVMDKDEFIEAIKNNHEFSTFYGDLGPIYGKQWRDWEYVEGLSVRGASRRNDRVIRIDQIANLINDLKTNPDSRRLMVSAWNVGEIDQMTLPPCHYGFQVYTRELSLKERSFIANSNHYEVSLNIKGIGVDENHTLHKQLDDINIPKRAISLMWNQRSVDTPLGLPFNIASYGLLLEIIAKTVNMVPEELIGNLGDTHIYLDQVDGVKEQIGRDLSDEERYNIWFNANYETGMERFFDPNNLPDFDNPWYDPTPKRSREPYKLPTLKHMKTDEFYRSLGENFDLISHLDPGDFVIENYKSHPAIKFPLSN